MRVVSVGGVIMSMAMALALAVWLRPQERLAAPLGSLESAIPERFGDWTIDPTIVPIPPAPDVQAQLDQVYDQLIARTYVNGRGERVMLLVAYRRDQNDAVRPHHQEVCYRAQGFGIRDLRHEEMRVLDRVIPVVRVHAVQASRSEPVTYWMTMGERIAWSRAQRMAAQLHYGLRGQLVDGVLVRVSSLQLDAGAGYRLHGSFLNDLVGSLPPALVPRFIGAASPTIADRRGERPNPRNT